MRTIDHALTRVGVTVRQIDTSLENCRVARMKGLPTYQASILSEANEETDPGSLGKLSLTANDDVNMGSLRN